MDVPLVCVLITLIVICDDCLMNHLVANAQPRPSSTMLLMMLQALAAETGRSFVKIGNSQIFGKYMGESEKGMKDVFRKAKEAAPSILFFDEVSRQLQLAV